ncbi:MAG: hypothetical protein LLF96_04625 [Eubacteriales bacterium]|nr:hypothetical protein [Eubacteriales bacterium]
MKIVHATCEMENLGVDAYEILLSSGDSPADYAGEEQRLLAAGAQYLVVKTPVNDAQWLFGLPQLGYAFVETVFHVAVKRTEYRPPAELVRFDRGLSVTERTESADQERIYGLIRSGIFKSDRVSIDPVFTTSQSGNRYANWLRQMLGEGGRLYEVLQGERPIGFFVITRVDEQTVDPVLMGLYDENRDRGMGALLHKKMLDTCFTYDCARLTSTIVSNNLKVLRVYFNAGALITDTLYTYVKHPQP